MSEITESNICVDCDVEMAKEEENVVFISDGSGAEKIVCDSCVKKYD